MARPDAERVWLAFAQSAITGMTSIDVERDPHNGPTWDEINESIADDAASMADAMLERWRMRYGEEEPAKQKGLAQSASTTTPKGPIEW